MLNETTRAEILAEPQKLLEDRDLLEALMTASDAARGQNVVDLRSIAMDRMSKRLDRLEDQHRSVIAAAYDTITGTQQIHRAVLHLLGPESFDDFLADLAGPVTEALRIDGLRLVLESPFDDGQDHGLDRFGHVLQIVPPQFVNGYMGGSTRKVVLRPLPEGVEALYAVPAGALGSEACIRLDLGDGRYPALLAMGAADPKHFTPQQGTDLLEFLGNVMERVLQHWLR